MPYSYYIPTKVKLCLQELPQWDYNNWNELQETFTPSPESLPSPTIFLISAFSRLSGESP